MIKEGVIVVLLERSNNVVDSMHDNTDTNAGTKGKPDESSGSIVMVRGPVSSAVLLSPALPALTETQQDVLLPHQNTREDPHPQCPPLRLAALWRTLPGPQLGSRRSPKINQIERIEPPVLLSFLVRLIQHSV